jgi:ketosteroid isomerase-like protein
MKRTVMVLLAVLVAMPLSRAQAQDKAAQMQKAEEIKKLDRKLCEAMEKGDADTIDRSTAEHYMLIDPTGNVWGKKKSLEAFKDKTVTFESIKDSDVKVHVYGDTAVITGLAAIKGKAKDHDINGEYRWTRVYNFSNGNWLCVTEHLTFVLNPEKLKKK